MEEPEVPMEQVHEHIEHHAHLSPEKWVSRVALSTAILAALAAVASLLAGDHANEAMLAQIQSSDQWNYYQAKGLKAAIADLKLDLVKSPADEEKSQHDRYVQEQAEIKKAAEEKTAEASLHLRKHVVLARSVTMFQIAIAIGAISILTKRKSFWVGSMAFGLMGVIFLLQGLLT